MSDCASETALLQAVRDRLRSQLPLGDHECEIEFDQMAPATVGSKYIVVLPGGMGKGPAHDGGHVVDEIVGVDVCVMIRATSVPRDRQRNVYLGNLTSLNGLIQRVMDTVDFQYEVLTAANAIIRGETGSVEGFVEPLRFSGLQARPSKVSGETFAATTEPAAGLARTVNFRGARRIQTR